MYPGDGPSCLVKGLPLHGLLSGLRGFPLSGFRATTVPLFWKNRSSTARNSGASALSIDSRRYSISVFQIFRIPCFPAFLLSCFPDLAALGGRCSLVASMPDLVPNRAGAAEPEVTWP